MSNLICKQCKNEIKKLNFSEEEKLEIFYLLIQDLRLFAVKKIMDAGNYSHRESKIIVDHINKEFGKCIRCNFSSLQEEYIECPKCKAFNYNFKTETPFTEEFCIHLEYKLDFDDLGDDDLIGFWCDGINHIPNDSKSLSKSNIEKNKKIITQSWIGKDGQDKYEMTIIMGERAIENYKNNLDLIDCIPERNFKEWIKIEPKKKEIHIYLK